MGYQKQNWISDSSLEWLGMSVSGINTYDDTVNGPVIQARPRDDCETRRVSSDQELEWQPAK